MTTSTEKSKADVWNELDAESVSASPSGSDAAKVAVEQPTPGDLTAAETAPAPARAQADAGVDAYVGLPQAFRDELHGYKKLLDGQQDRLRKAEGRIGELLSKVNVPRSEPQSPARVPTKDQVAAAQSGGGAAMGRLREDYPQFADALDAALTERLDQALPKNVATKDDLEALNRSSSERLTAAQIRSTVDAAHPGWLDHVQTPRFQGWLDRQSPDVKALAASDKPADAIRLLDIEAQARGEPAAPTANKSQDRLRNAAALPTRGRTSNVRVKSLDEMTDAEYWQHLEAQDKRAQAQT